VTVQESAPVVEQALPPGEASTEYWMIAEPLSGAAVQVTSAETSNGVAATPAGASGSPAGVTEFDSADADPAPSEFVATTENVYARPFVRPVTAHDRTVVDVHVLSPGVEVTVYPLIGEPLASGACQVTDADMSPRVAVTPVGASGGPGLGVTGSDAAEAGPCPTAFEALTVKVYGVPFVRPATLHVSAPVVEHVAPPGDAVTE
jgi:hypothetical protein